MCVCPTGTRGQGTDLSNDAIFVFVESMEHLRGHGVSIVSTGSMARKREMKREV